MADRIVEVIDDRQTGETILDETLKMMKMQQEVEKLSINSWVDLLSGEFSFFFLFLFRILFPFFFLGDYLTDGIQFCPPPFPSKMESQEKHGTL